MDMRPRPSLCLLLPVLSLPYAAGARVGPPRIRRPAPACLDRLGPVSSKHPLPTREVLRYRVTAHGLPVGEMTLMTAASRDGAAIRLGASGRTSSVLGPLVRAEGQYLVRADPDSLRPHGVQVRGAWDRDRRWESVRFTAPRTAHSEYLVRGRAGQRSLRLPRHSESAELLELLTVLARLRRSLDTNTRSSCFQVVLARQRWRLDLQAGPPMSGPVAWRTGGMLPLALTLSRPGRREKLHLRIVLRDDRHRTPVRMELQVGAHPVVAELI